MWLTKQLRQTEEALVSSGKVSGDGSFSVVGEREYRSPEILFPYGFSSQAESGGKAVMVSGFCAGVSSLPDSSLEEGEVRLYSAGGAEILLKNNGQVVINGQVFQAR